MRLEHYLLTKFNVRRVEVGTRPDRDWLDHRFELFERYCLPSVAGQTCQDFTWLIRWDEEGMSDEHRRRLRAHETDLPNLRLVPERLSFQMVIGRSLKGWRRKRLLTTRLDNDDALGRDAVAVLQSEARGGRLEFLNLPLGYCLEHPSGRMTLTEQPHNPFISLAEDVRREAPHTAVCVNHHEAEELAPIRQVGAARSWLQVVHDRNLYNYAIGSPCEPPDLGSLFNVEV